MVSFQQTIKAQFQQLSKGQQRVAKYLLDYPQIFAVKSAEQIGKDVGVSETTVIRFCYSLQFNGFSELQKNVREGIFLRKSSLNQYYSNKLELSEQPHFFTHAMEQDCQNIKKTAEQIDEEQFERVVDHLIQAEQVYITGLRLSYSAAHWLSFSLGLIRQNVFLYKPDTDDLMSTLERMNENSIFIAISFHRYLKETVKMAELAKQQGAIVIGITDSQLAPISQFSDILLPISLPERSTLDATPALFSLLNAIVAMVSVKDHERFEKRKQQYETFALDHLFCD